MNDSSGVAELANEGGLWLQWSVWVVWCGHEGDLALEKIRFGDTSELDAWERGRGSFDGPFGTEGEARGFMNELGYELNRGKHRDESDDEEDY